MSADIGVLCGSDEESFRILLSNRCPRFWVLANVLPYGLIFCFPIEFDSGD